MGTTARVFVHGGPDGLAARLQDRLAELESRWSRFVGTSEISLLNACPGRPVAVSSDTVTLVERAVMASQRTGGWFDPLLLRALEAAGYDRTWDDVRSAAVRLVAVPDARSSERLVAVHDWRAAAARIVIDSAAGTVTVPVGAAFDPGGIGKGLAADMVLTEAFESGADAVLVSLGGDIVCGGRPPEGGWSIAIENPFDLEGEPMAHVRIPWGAVATSTTARRRWLADDGIRHHLIDPSTRQPSGSDLVSVTAVAGPCWLAESVAKAALMAGCDEGTVLLERNGIEALLVDAAGGRHLTTNMAAYLA